MSEFFQSWVIVVGPDPVATAVERMDLDAEGGLTDAPSESDSDADDSDTSE